MDRPARTSPRSRRDLSTDVAFVVISAGLGVVSSSELAAEGVPAWQVAGSVVAGLGASGALWYRRRWPVQLALATALLACFIPAVTGAALLSVFSVAVHRPWRTAVIVGSIAAGCAAVANAIDTEGESVLLLLALVAILYSALVGWGMYVRARRELLESLKQRARDAEADRDLREARARAAERARIAREMHDVLAHRISLVALNAGALEYRPDAPPEEIARAAGAVRENAHQALEELREVIILLRDHPDPAAGTAPPQPTLRDLEALIDDSRDAGMTVELTLEAEGLEALPEGTGRTAYRVIQEGLTNVRKHAPGASPKVTVAGDAEGGLTVRIANGPGRGDGSRTDPIPGTGTGLTGLTERVGLAGGTLDHAPQPEGGFLLAAWLPWTQPVQPAGRPGPVVTEGEATG